MSLLPCFHRASEGPRGPEVLVPVGGAVGGVVARSWHPSFGGNWTRLVWLPGELVSDLYLHGRQGLGDDSTWSAGSRGGGTVIIGPLPHW